MMLRSFYQYLMTLRNPDGRDEISNFANNAFFDLSFPKQSEDYNELSEYLELSAPYLQNMSVFDEVFLNYKEKNTR